MRGGGTNTTKERLNGILSAFNLWVIKQIKGVWYIINGENKEEFNGSKTFTI